MNPTIEEMAKLICANSDGGISLGVDTVVCTGQPYRTATGYVVPTDPMMVHPLWHEHVGAARAILDRFDLKAK